MPFAELLKRETDNALPTLVARTNISRCAGYMNAYMEIIDPIGIGTIALKTLIDSFICQKGNVIPLPAASRGLRDRPPGKSKPLEPGHLLLGSSQRSVDQQANRGAQSDRGATLNSGFLSSSRGVTSFLKVTDTIAPKRYKPKPIPSTPSEIGLNIDLILLLKTVASP